MHDLDLLYGNHPESPLMQATLKPDHDMANRAQAIAAMGLVSKNADGSFDVMELGFGRGSATVTSDRKGCSMCDGKICLHREAARFFVEPPPKPTTPRAYEPSGPNVARSMADLVTPRQLVTIRVIANSKGLNAEAESERVLGCRPEYVSRRAASRLIGILKAMR